MSIADRLVELGIELPAVAAPVASYAPAVVSGNYVYTAGQLPFVDGAIPVAGKVGGGAIDVAIAAAQARQCALNALAAVASAVGSLDRVKRIVKVTGFVASATDFTAQPSVVNGASDVLAEIFGDAGVHARSAVGVAVLPLDAPVEVELIAQIE